MHKIVLKYVQLFCIALFFDNVSCDNISLEASRNDMLLNQEVGCTAACMQTNSTAVLSNCHDICKMSNKTVKLQEIDGNETVRLICREDDSLTIELSNDMIPKPIENENQQRQFKGSLFLFKLQENNIESPQRIVYITDSPIVRIENLQQNTTYNVTASIFNGNLEYRHLTHMWSFKTLETDKYVPMKISNDSIKLKYAPDNDLGKLITTIEWEPAEDMVCNYFFHLYSTNGDTYSALSSQVFRMLKPSELYHLTMDMLKFDTEYVLEIHGNNAKNELIEGDKSSLEFITPTCWQVHEYSLQKCRPPPLVNINSTYELIESDFYRINVTWDLPKHQPDYYNVSLNLNSKGIHVSQNVSGSDSYAFFPEVNISDIHYDVTIMAYSSGGQTLNPSVCFNLKHSNFFIQYKRILIVIGILSPFVVLLSVSFIFVVIQNRRNRLRHKKDIFSKEMYLRKLIHSHNKDEMEIEPTNVELFEVLGEGAFGIVRKGLLKPTSKAIAVKMLKENAGIEDIKGFLSEITLMKSVGHHENIVGIVGHSTKLYNKMMLLTEYCSEGNLLDYLRKFREAFSPEQFYLTTQTGVMTFSAFEKSPEDLFNFNSKSVDKITLKDRSMSTIDPKNMLGANEQHIQYPKSNMQNIIFNRLYDEHALEEPKCEKQHSCNISYENEIDNATKANDCNCSHFNEVNHNKVNRKCTNKPKNLTKNGEGVVNPEVLLFAENQAYDLLVSSENGIQSKSFNNDEHEMKPLKADQHNALPYLTGRDLLMFAKQIATGMAFLANNKIVHRDLAARNVLVCTDKTVKIADFGLSRDIYVDNIYMKATAGRLPIKWLALESMTDQKYTSQSDVWSYGILLYEIVTLGCTPYPTVPVDCLVNYLKSGNRMSKPHNCSQEFYDLMFSCWHCEPGDRPTFNEILRKIDWFIHQSDTNGVLRVEKLDKNNW
ncbi:tyrosine-protein kinase receptor torso-like isoform X2 [Sitodiplosis mosellana]|nr:tyrosine-protein kinase receptor torso-like isoform X2 [Sitodiplosis mosellana]